MSGLALLLPLMLQASTATPPPAVNAAPTTLASTAADKMICKKRARIGTLASFDRECHTRAEWDRIQHQTRDEWESLQGTKGSTSGH